MPSSPRTNAGGGVYEASANSYVILPQVSDHAHFNDSFNALDFRLDRTFNFGERYSLTLIGEAFNIFNVTNILGVSNLNYSGFANTLVAGPRQSQLLLELRHARFHRGRRLWFRRAARLPVRGAIQLLIFS